jgi:two-component system, NtrC family, response regulator AtoC
MRDAATPEIASNVELHACTDEVPPEHSSPIIADAKMVSLYQFLAKVSPSSLPVLLLGETGCGKEVIADWIFRHSGQAAGHIVKINCAGLPESVVESQLFGHEKGAFTGATNAHKGFFETAHGGTLFLDEVGELSLTTQAKVLRVLETGEYMRLGSTHCRNARARIIAATNRNLPALADKGLFRQDLYFRLAAAAVDIPSLRDRPCEIVPLSQRFLELAAGKLGRMGLTLAESAASRLRSHHWPGNIRELRNVIERSAIMCEGDSLEGKDLCIGEAMWSADFRSDELAKAPESAKDPSLKSRVRQAERSIILCALQQENWNCSRAARTLRISRRTLYNKMSAMGIAETPSN